MAEAGTPITTGPTAGAAVPGRVVDFALTPAQAVRDLYDYNTTKDAKIYKMATDPLLTKHDGTIATLRPMLDQLLMRVKDFSWDTLVSIEDDDKKAFNVILQNRALTMNNVANSARTYLGTQTRTAQDNYLMVQCILNSLDADGAKALRNSQYSYVQNGEPCAALLVKVLLLDCEVETASTNFFVRAQLGDLEQHMVSIDYDVIVFNKHVSELLRKLRQGGEESHDDVLFIYMHVMRAYLICPDPDFLLAIKLQKLKAEGDPKLLTLPILMITAQIHTKRCFKRALTTLLKLTRVVWLLWLQSTARSTFPKRVGATLKTSAKTDTRNLNGPPSLQLMESSSKTWMAKLIIFAHSINVGDSIKRLIVMFA
jgi:hypothetical protein